MTKLVSQRGPTFGWSNFCKGEIYACVLWSLQMRAPKATFTPGTTLPRYVAIRNQCDLYGHYTAASSRACLFTLTSLVIKFFNVIRARFAECLVIPTRRSECSLPGAVSVTFNLFKMHLTPSDAEDIIFPSLGCKPKWAGDSEKNWLAAVKNDLGQNRFLSIFWILLKHCEYTPCKK